MGTNYFYISQHITEVYFFINLIFSILTFYLIKKINKDNGYMKIVYSLTFSQFLFEIGILIQFSLFGNENNIIKDFIWNFIILAGGMLTSLYTFILCNILCYVVVTRKYLDISYFEKKIDFIFLSFVYIT